MKFGILRILAAVILFGVLPIPVRLAAQNARSEIITFDAPGAISVAGSLDGTFPKSINAAGTIAGNYIDANGLYHGFLRSPAGEFIRLDAPGEGTSVGSRFRTFPSTININNRGTITGNYVDAHHVNHGFLRSPGGEFTSFDAPGASSVEGSFNGTFPNSINHGGTIAGNYVDSRDVNHGFLHNPGGGFISFDAPGASNVGYGTLPKSINDDGAIAGYYTDARNVTHGFMRSPSGEFTSFDGPGANSVAAPGYGTFPESIDAVGTITGHYTDARDVTHGFVRSPSGEFTSFDGPGANSVAAPGYGTFPESINAAGAITGHYADARRVNHGFVRSPTGKLTTFDAPSASKTEGSGWGTFPDSINDAGAITGHYTDAVGLNHGFLRIP